MAINKCRACLIEKNCSDLCDWNSPVDVVNEKLTYQECFRICTQLDVKKANDTSSYINCMHFLCCDCVQELKSSFQFIRKAQRSARELYYLSQKNGFEYINIEDCCKSENFKEIPPMGEVSNGKQQTVAVTAVKLREELTPYGRKFESFKPAKNQNGPLQSICLSHADTPSKDYARLDIGSELNFFQNKRVVKQEKDKDALSKQYDTLETSFNNSRLNGNLALSVDCKSDALRKKNSKPENNVKTKEVKKSILKRIKSKKFDTDCKQIPCEYCKKLFPENRLKQHKSRYHRPKIFLCDICPSSFSIANNLRRHQRTHELNRERNFSCSECGRTFFTEDVYRTHIKIHQSSRQAKFKCTQCDKVFMHKGSLTLHIQKHTGPKNECGVCMKRYVRKIDLEVHMRNHSGDLPYQCSNCEKAFMTTSALRKHELLHKGIKYKCDICNKEYSHPSKLSRHRLDHTGLPLKCTMCNKGFAEPNKVRRHIKSVHKVDDSSQINKLIIKIAKSDECLTK